MTKERREELKYDVDKPEMVKVTKKRSGDGNNVPLGFLFGFKFEGVHSTMNLRCSKNVQLEQILCMPKVRRTRLVCILRLSTILWPPCL